MNAVFQKDILSLLRQPWTAVVHIIFVAAMVVMVLATWPQQGVVSLATRAQDALLLGLILGQTVLMALVVPGSAGVAITSEREQGTLEMIYASRLPSAQFILGKLLSTLAFPLLLLLSGLPFVALLIYRGDVDLARMSRAYLVVMTTAAMLAMLSLAISALCRQSSTSLVASYVASLLVCGAVLAPAAIMLSTQSGPSAQALHYARSISPVAAALSVLRPHWNEFGGREGGIDPASGLAITALPPSWTIFFPAAAAVVVGCLVITVLALRRPPLERMPAGTRPPRRTLLRRLLFIIDPNRPPKPIGRVNPMMAKETRTNPLRAGPWMIRTFYAALFVALVLALMAMTGGQTEHGDLLLYTTMILVSFQICVIALVAPSLTSSAVSAELENSTFELLRLTRLRPGSIFWGKLIPVILPSLLPVAAMLPAYAAIGYVDPTYVRPLLRLLPILVSMTLLCACCGLLCSSFTAATARATIAAYIIVVALVVLPLAAWISAGSFISPTLASRLATPSPMVTALSQFPGAIQAEPDLWRNHLLLVSLLIAGFIACTRWRLRALLKRG